MTAFFLAALLDGSWQPDAHTEVAAQVVANSQWVDGRWNQGTPRYPIVSSDIVATALARTPGLAWAGEDMLGG